jgi:hypothetical protein
LDEVGAKGQGPRERPGLEPHAASQRPPLQAVAGLTQFAYGWWRWRDLQYFAPAAYPPPPLRSQGAGSRAAPEPYRAEATQRSDIFVKIERLADLQQKGILSPEEFAAKKAELLSRL